VQSELVLLVLALAALAATWQVVRALVRKLDRGEQLHVHVGALDVEAEESEESKSRREQVTAESDAPRTDNRT
jgi:hypothetical protein